MGFRFQRRITLMPGVRLNFSKSGVGLSVGPRGMSLSAGPSGVHANAGLPGTGLSYRTKLGGGRRGRATSAAPAPLRSASTSSETLTLVVRENGLLALRTPAGVDRSELLPTVLQTQPVQVQQVLRLAAQQANALCEAARTLHHAVQRPIQALPTSWPDLSEPLPPKVPAWRRWLGWDGAQRAAHATAVTAWQAQVLARAELASAAVAGDALATLTVLPWLLSGIAWPRETRCSFEWGEPGTLLIDIDLPEIEDFPTQRAVINDSLHRLDFKPLSPRQRQGVYADYVYGALARTVGSVLAFLPAVQMVVATGYTQRPNALGELEDVDIIHGRFTRADWQQLPFEAVGQTEPKAWLAPFALVVQPLRDGGFGAITVPDSSEAIQ